MDDAARKPSYDASRRLRWMGVIILATVAIYVAGWFWIAAMVDRAVGEAASQSEQSGIAWQCPGQQVIGFPFRIGIFCDEVDVMTADGLLTIEGGAVRTAAQIYSPRRIIMEADSPVTVSDTANNQSYLIAWERGRGSAVTAPPAERMMSFLTNGLIIDAFDLEELVTADEAAIHGRERNGAVDIAFNGREIRLAQALVGGRQLPAFGVDLDLTLEAFETDWTGPAANRLGTANRIGLLLTNDRGVIVEGPFSVSREGLLSGEFAVRIVDVPGVFEAAQESFPEYAPALEAIAANQPRQDGQPDDEVALTLTIRDGVVRAGFIPLGRIPPLPIGALGGL